MYNKNIIQKQALHFQYNGKADGFALQKEVSEWCTFTLIPEVEKQLESFATGNDYITIDKIEIDATVNINNWQQKIRDELLSGLGRKLSQYRIENNADADNRSAAALVKLDELILFYFEKGCLPWWSAVLIDNDFKMVLHNWIQEDMPQSRADNIRIRLQEIISKPVVKRISDQVPEQLYFQFIKNIFKKETELINLVESFLNETIAGSITVAKQKEIKKRVFGFILTMMTGNAGKIDTGLILQFFYEELKTQKTAVSILKPVLSKPDEVADPVKSAWQQLLKKEDKASEKKTRDSQKKETKLKYNKIIDELTIKINAEKRKVNMDEVVQEGIYIENAGTVIIAAFIPALFEKLKITKTHTIVKNNLAAMIIQYTVTGNIKMAEHELVLPKILCGIDPELPVNTNTKISAAQTKEADKMLLSVIEYWAVIKNTSLNGLRESFLKRSGKLSLVKNEWLLQVEQKPFDMLLQQLPWSISMIKLPWMKNLLKTEWI